MPLFACSRCGVVENTALSLYWIDAGQKPPLCSECNPRIGRWHGRFPRERADGYVQDRHGHIYRPEETAKFAHLGPFTPLELPPVASQPDPP